MAVTRLRWTHSLGLDPSVTSLNVCSYSTSAFFSIAFLVFINSQTPFVLTNVLHVPTEKIAQITGALIFADELLALPAVLVWGHITDKIGSCRPVAVLGHLICGIGLVVFVNARRAYPDLLLARLLFAVGASALTTMLSAVLASMTATEKGPHRSNTSEDSRPLPAEAEPLLQDRARTVAKEAAANPAASARLAGLIGMASGLGAVLAVFVFLRLPAALSRFHDRRDPSESLAFGLRATFYIVAACAICEGLFLIIGLKRKGSAGGIESCPVMYTRSPSSSSRKDRVLSATSKFFKGFGLFFTDGEVSLACMCGFAARAQTIVTSTFIPVLVNQYFVSSGACNLDSPGMPPEAVKESCRDAFVLASIITGVIQLIALLASPIMGWLASIVSQALLLTVTFLAGVAGFLLIGFLPNGDPRSALVWPAAILLGISQISGIVVSLALTASARVRLVKEESEEVAGRLAGMYSWFGGLGILFISGLSGRLSSMGQAPFFIAAAVDGVAAVWAFGYLVWPHARRRRTPE